MALKFMKKQKGFALIFVMVFVAMIMSIVSDVVYQTQITAKNSMIQQDQLYAKIAARTGLEFAKFLLVLNKLAVPYQNNPMFPLPKNLFGLLNGQPIGADSFDQIAQLTGVDFSKILDPELLKALKAMKGNFVLKITSENTKLNLNLLQSTYSNMTSKAILRMLSAPDMEKFLALYDYTPQQLADNLTAYIKISVTDGALEGRSESDYNRLGLKYKPKHAAIESLEELRRIPGFEVDDIYNVLSPYFTIWPINGPQNSLNINSAPTELIASLISPLGQEPDDKDWDKFDDYRVRNTFAQNNIGSWFTENLNSYKDDKDADDIRKNIFGITDTIFKIQCRGVYNGVEKTAVIVIQQNADTAGGPAPKKVETKPNSTPAPKPTGPDATGEPSSKAIATDNKNNQQQNNNPLNAGPPPPIDIIYSQWAD